MIYRQMPRVAAVRHIREHVLWPRFSDGVEGEIDLNDELPAAPCACSSTWRDVDQSELMANWDRLVTGQAPQPIVPLS